MNVVTSAVRKERSDVTVLDQHRQESADHILRVARRVVAAKGLATRLEDVAAEAGVSQRAVARQFPTTDALITGVVEAGLRSFDRNIPRFAPGDDPSTWLEKAMIAIHEMNFRHRKLYYQLAGEGALPAALAQARADRHQGRVEMVARFTARCWDVFGGAGRPPIWLADIVAVQLSPYATQALTVDFARTPADAGRTAAKTVRLVITAALDHPDQV